MQAELAIQCLLSETKSEGGQGRGEEEGDKCTEILIELPADAAWLGGCKGRIDVGIERRGQSPPKPSTYSPFPSYLGALLRKEGGKK